MLGATRDGDVANALAGPGEPSLAFSDDPAHHWLRAAWEGMEADPRVPMVSATGVAGR